MPNMKSQKGFTLIEVIASLALIGIVAAVFLSVFTFGIDEIFSMGRKSTATKIAEQCINVYYQNVDSNGHYDDANMTLKTTAEAEIATIRSANPAYIVTNTVTGQADGLYVVDITVAYRSSSRTVHLSAIVP